MALNWAMIDSDRAPVPLPHEMTITTVSSGAEITLAIPSAAASGSTSTKLKESGKIWVTDQRLIFVGPEKSDIQSLSIPLHQIMSSKFEQPMFGANYLVLGIAPSAEGGLTRGTTAELRFKDEALFGFVRTLEKTREHAIETRHNNQAAADEAEGLPAYSSGSGSAGGSSAAPAPSVASPTFSGAPPPPPNEAPPGYDA